MALPARTVRAMSDNAVQEYDANGRRLPGPHATQPRVGDTMVRISNCIFTTTDFLNHVAASGELPTPGAIAQLIAERISATDHFTERQVTLDVLVAVASREASLAARLAETALAQATSTTRRRATARLDTWVVKALKNANINTSPDDLEALNLLANPTAQLAARLLAAEAAAHQATNGYLLEELEDVYDSVVHPHTPTTAIAALVERGIDGESLCWAVVSRESRRHILLVMKEANRAARSYNDLSAEHLIGYAYQGLRLALRNYDPARGMFSTYACPRIRGTIRDGIRSESHLPKRLITFVRKVERTREQLSQNLGRHPTLAEVAGALDVDLDKIARVTTYATPASYDELLMRPGFHEPAALVDDADPLDASERLARRGAIDQALAKLPLDEATAVRLLVLEEMPVSEAEELSGLPARQLRAARSRGLEALASLLSEWAPGVNA